MQFECIKTGCLALIQPYSLIVRGDAFWLAPSTIPFDSNQIEQHMVNTALLLRVSSEDYDVSSYDPEWINLTVYIVDQWWDKNPNKFGTLISTSWFWHHY